MAMHLAICIPTYNRAQIVGQCVQAIRQNLTGAELHFFIGIAGNDETEKVFMGRTNVSPIQNLGAGLGKNLNDLLRIAFRQYDYVMQLDDDHILTKPMNIGPVLEAMEKDARLSWVRLMHVAAHNLVADLDGSFWKVRWDSPEVYIASNRPHIKHRRFHETFGMYPENIKLGLTEEGFCHQCRNQAKEIDKPPLVAVPLDLPTESGWEHIGQSWQLKGF